MNENLLSKLEAVSQIIPPAELVAVMNNVAAAAREIARSNVEIETIRSQRQVALATIRERHQTLRLAMSHIFAERSAIIEEQFRLIDVGMAQQNDAMIDKGLAGLAAVVNTSPFSNLKQLGDIIDAGGTIEI